MQPRIRKLPSKPVISDEARIVAFIDRHEFSKVVKLALKSPQFDGQYLLTVAAKIAEYNYWGAKFVFEKAFGKGVDAPEAYYLYGNYLKNTGKFRKAEDLFRKAALKHPELHGIFTELGVILLLLKRPEEAEVQLRKSVELNPNDAYAWTSLGSALMV
ncbi:MAG: tetratricopeptide repeat protein, partial [Methanosarcinales archaeon]|nr:tetratricopeptide repeat protein [Methanosarcinales archaeon]